MKSPGAVLMMGLQGPQLLKEELSFLKKHQPAGVILFKRNISSCEQLKELNKELKSLLKPRLLIAVDCEGGKVNRLSHLSLNWPSPEKMAQLGFEERKLLIGKMAQKLKALGFDINFAPVLDWPALESELLKGRVMGSSPNQILKNAELFVQIFLKKGIWPCLKHFPGHGGVKEDSHKELPVDLRDFKSLRTQLDLFYRLFSRYETGIMTAHIQFPKMDSDPATFSSFFLTKLLRERMGFKGLIFSDDMDMKALEKFSPGERLFSALKAGCDVILSCQKPESPYQMMEYFKKDPVKIQQIQKELKKSQARLLKWRAP